MRYVNVPLPKPIIKKIDKIVADQENDFRSRPDFILHHIRIALQNRVGQNQLQNVYPMPVLRQSTNQGSL